MLYVSPVGERGGAETVLLNLLRLHDRPRFRPFVCFLKAGPLVDEARRVTKDVAVFPTGRVRSLSTVLTIQAIRRLIARERIDIVFGNMAMGHVYGGIAALGTGARAVWFEHGIVDAPDMLDRVAARVPAAITFAASAAAARARATRNGSTPICVVPAGIDIDEYDPARHPHGLLRRELGIDPEAPVVVCIARLQRWKGQSLFLQAAAAIRREIPRAHFVIAGGTLFGLEADYAHELQRSAVALFPEGGVHFLGHRDDVPAVLADADVLVHCPIRPEPFGLVVVEAMAMGVPVVSVSGSGPEETLTPDTGVLVAPGDARALANAVVTLLQDPGRRNTMGQAAQCRARERFSAARMVRDIEHEFERLVTR